MVQALANLRPRAASVDLRRDLVRLVRKQVVLLPPATLELARAERKELLLPQERRVELLADRVITGRARLVRLEKPREVLEGAGRRRSGFRDLLPEHRVLDLLGDKLANVARRRVRLADRAIEVHARDEREVHVRFSVGNVPGDSVKPRARRLGQVTLRPETVEEERENATQRGIQVRIRLPLPIKARLHELSSAERRKDDVTVDALGRTEAVVGHGRKALGPVEHGRVTTTERLCREVFRALVICGEAEHAGPGRGFLVAVGEVVLDQRRKRRGRHDATSPTMAKATD